MTSETHTAAHAWSLAAFLFFPFGGGTGGPITSLSPPPSLDSPPPQSNSSNSRQSTTMSCFGGGRRTPSSGAAVRPSSSQRPEDDHRPRRPGSRTAEQQHHEELSITDDVDGERIRSPLSATAQTPSAASAGASPTINLSLEYTLAVQTSSYKEIWSKIHRPAGRELREGEEDGDLQPDEHEDEDEEDRTPSRLIARVLQPDRKSIQAALGAVPPSRLSCLVSEYFESSEHTSHFCLALGSAVERARTIYAHIDELLEVLPPPSASPDDRSSPSLTQAQIDWAFEIFLEFDGLDNPFPAPSGGVGGSSCSFQGMRGCFPELKQQLDLRLRKVRRRHLALRRATRGAGACLIVSSVGVVVAGLALATHALVTLMAGPALLLGGCLPTKDLLEGSRQRLKDHMAQLEAAARGAYVLNNDLDTIERLVAKLHGMVEDDKELMKLGLAQGRGQRHPIEGVVCRIQQNRPRFVTQLDDLEEHICLYFTAVNRARSLLLGQLHRPAQPT